MTTPERTFWEVLMKLIFASMFAALLFAAPAIAQEPDLCTDTCTSCTLTATDALAVLNTAIGLNPVSCPSTTTSSSTSSTSSTSSSTSSSTLEPTTTTSLDNGTTTTSSTTTTTVQSLGCAQAAAPECASDTCLPGWSCEFNGVDVCKCSPDATTTTMGEGTTTSTTTTTTIGAQ
jgi:cytoskeletal protein RodZ